MKIVSAALCRFLFLFVLAGVCEAEEAQEKQDDSQNAPSSFPPLVPGVPSRLPREKQMQEETVAKALLVVHQDLTTTDKVENNDERMDNERMDKGTLLEAMGGSMSLLQPPPREDWMQYDLDQKIDYIERIASQAAEGDALLLQIDEHDSIIGGHIAMVREELQRGQKVVSDIVQFMSDARDSAQISSEESNDPNEDKLLGNGIVSTSTTQRRMSNARTSPKYRRRRTSEKKQRQSAWDHFESPSHTGRHRRVQEMHEAMLNGDAGFFGRKVSSSSYQSPKFRRHGRRTSFTDLNGKEGQCSILINCTERMGLYDLFVYYYSDDIDPTDGTIDDPDDGEIFTFDEDMLFTKRNDIARLAREATAFLGNVTSGIASFSTGDDDLDDCDFLLQEFHRNIEIGGAVNWEGAMVNQVCLAEGTTAYVQLTEIEKVSPGVATQAFLDIFQCTRSLFNSNKRSGDSRFSAERFVFINEETNIIRFPTKFNTSLDGPRDKHGQLISNIDPFEYEDLSDFSTFRNDASENGAFNALSEDVNKKLLSPEELDSLQSTCRSSIERYYIDIFLNSVPGEDISYPAVFIQATNLKFECTPIATLVCHRWQYKLVVDAPVAGLTQPDCGTWFWDQIFGLLDPKENQPGCNTKCPYYSVGENQDFFSASPSVEKLQTATELVFGGNPSIGFVCGVAEAVIRDDASLPGYCCLDAPYQVDPWGSAFQCDRPDGNGNRIANDCRNVGPYFAGMSTETCDAYGGTWCPESHNCTRLMECIPEYLQCAEEENLMVYAEYLKAAPEIDDPTSFFECGRAREYFGFDENFLDDHQICQDVEQLRNTRDFDFLNGFFNQGGPACDRVQFPGGCDAAIMLKEPDLEFASEITNGQTWRSKNFNLAQIVAGLDERFNLLTNLDCPSGDGPSPTHAGSLTCSVAKTIATVVLWGISLTLRLIADISDFTYGEVAELGNVEPWEIYRNTNVIFENMETTFQYLNASFKQVLELLEPPGFLQGTKFAGCDGVDQDDDDIADDCHEDSYPPHLELPDFFQRTPDCKVADAICLDKYFKGSDDAIAYLKTIIVADDCASPAFLFSEVVELDGLCDESSFKVTPFHRQDTFVPLCKEYELSGEPVTFVVGVDNLPPVVTCGFKPAEADLETRVQVEGKFLFIPQNSNARLVDTSFYFDIEENCPGTSNVVVSVRSNELTEDPIGWLVKKFETGAVEQAALYVAPSSCSATGGTSPICAQDPATSIRFYEIEVVVTDLAGHVHQDTCTVVVVPGSDQGRKFQGKGEPPVAPLTTMELIQAVSASTVRYDVVSLSLQWLNELAPSAMPSAVPSISRQPSLSVRPSILPSREPSKSGKGKTKLGKR